MKGRINFSIIVRVVPQRDIVQLNGAVSSAAFPPPRDPNPHSSRGRRRIRSNQLTGINRSSPDKLFVEQQERNMWVETRAIKISISRPGMKGKRSRAAIGIARVGYRIVAAINHQRTLTICCMQSASISLRAATKKRRHYVCVRIHPTLTPECLFAVRCRN